MKSGPMISMLAVAALAVTFAPSIAGCKKTPLDPLPASGEVAGWQKAGETRTFAAKNLWQYIDGDAEQYLAAGVVSTSTSDYKYNGKIDAVVDVHTMKNADGAQKILAVGQTADGKPVDVGDQAFQYAQSVSFRKGATLVRIISYQSSAETPQALVGLARGIAGKL
jgi:hypothetical protein